MNYYSLRRQNSLKCGCIYNRASKHINQKVIGLKAKIDISIIRVGHFNTSALSN